DHADELVPDGHRHGNRLLRPSVPVIYMYVRPADGGFEDADEDVIALDFGQGDFLQPKSGLGFRLYDRLHRLFHGSTLAAAMRLSILRGAPYFEKMNNHASDA